MRVILDYAAGTATVIREKGDPVFRNQHTGWAGAAGERGLLYRIRNALRRDGIVLVMRKMIEDGHAASTHQWYLRSATIASPRPHLALYNPHFQSYGAHERYNEGEVTLRLLTNIFQEE